jgi:hypothetical protein
MLGQSGSSGSLPSKYEYEYAEFKPQQQQHHHHQSGYSGGGSCRASPGTMSEYHTFIEYNRSPRVVDKEKIRCG